MYATTDHIAVHPKSRRPVRFNLTKVYVGIQHAAARLEASGRKVSAYEFDYVKQYAQVLEHDTDPTIQGLALGLLYAHLALLGKDSAQ